MHSLNELLNHLETLKLFRVKENVNQYLDLMADGKITPLDALNELFKKEMKCREDVDEIACVKVANFPFQISLEEFNFDFQPSIDKRKIMDLATLRFLETNENIVFYGTPGVGKTHLAVALGTIAAKQRYSVYFITFHELINQLRKAKYENRLETRVKWFCRYKLLCIDEVGYEKMDEDTANLFFNLISKR